MARLRTILSRVEHVFRDIRGYFSEENGEMDVPISWVPGAQAKGTVTWEHVSISSRLIIMSGVAQMKLNLDWIRQAAEIPGLVVNAP